MSLVLVLSQLYHAMSLVLVLSQLYHAMSLVLMLSQLYHAMSLVLMLSQLRISCNVTSPRAKSESCQLYCHPMQYFNKKR